MEAWQVQRVCAGTVGKNQTSAGFSACVNSGEVRPHCGARSGHTSPARSHQGGGGEERKRGLGAGLLGRVSAAQPVEDSSMAAWKSTPNLGNTLAIVSVRVLYSDL